MAQAVITKNIIREIEQLKAKMRLLGSLRRFKEIAEKGRLFAKKNRITLSHVLKDD